MGAQQTGDELSDDVQPSRLIDRATSSGRE
jgi:hypothetical protein